MGPKVVKFHPDAAEEAEAARNWYEERSIVASRAFISELRHAVDQIAQPPEMWPTFELDTRPYVFPKFPFNLIYSLVGNEIQIIAVAHSKRKPGYWKNR